MPDRFGEPVDPDPHECDRGWIDSEADHPAPCPVSDALADPFGHPGHHGDGRPGDHPRAG